MEKASLIIDLTDRCNARCRYCRWGDGRTAERRDLPVADLCVSVDTLRAGGVWRVVFSGGEPLLHHRLNDVLSYYADAAVSERVVITNGLLASAARLDSARRAGATGFAFSIDAVDEQTTLATRAMDSTQTVRVLANLKHAASLAERYGLEVTVNCVLSAANCSVETIGTLARSAAKNGASTIKFQPVFDDGYLGNNAPDLQLRAIHAAPILDIEADARNWGITTNPVHFFTDLAAMCAGQEFEGDSCGLGERSLVLQRDGIVVCPWIRARAVRTTNELPTMLQEFRKAKSACRVGPHCFCLQSPEHAWGFRDAVS